MKAFAVRRAMVTALGLVSALLLSGSPTANGGAADGAFASDAAAADAPFTAAQMRDQLLRFNSSLSPREIDRIANAILRSSERYGLDPALVTAVLLVESGARPWARSPKGAIGLMQVMPYMAAPLDIAGNLATIESNVEAGCLILADNIRRLGEEDGISAYFWGSNIRGVSYLHRVRETRARLRARSAS